MAPGQQPLAVSEQGFSVFPSGFGDVSNGSYGAVVVNPNQALAATNVAINVTFTDAAGAVVGQQREFVELVLPGQTAAVGGPLNGLSPSTVAMNVEIASAEFQPMATAPGAIAIDEVAVAPSEGGYTTTGLAHNSFAVEASAVVVVAIYRDGAGQIVGADIGYLDPIPPGGTVAFTVEGFDAVPDVATVTPTASLTLQLLGN